MLAEPPEPADDIRFATSHEYVSRQAGSPVAEFEPAFDHIIKILSRYHLIGPETQMFEVGAGLGWFEIIAAQRGLSCSAIDHNPVIRDAALDLARLHAVEVDIALGSVEDVDLGTNRYDVIIATSVFEHVRRYESGLARIYQALRPGGVFYFYSTNKFSLRSGEYPDFPLYGWLPYAGRRRIRVARQGPAIVESGGIDFNQFTYWGLVRHLKSLGFTRVVDRVDYYDPVEDGRQSIVKSVGIRALRALPPLKLAARAFTSGNSLVCVK